jgi:hypothetical protein
MWNYVDLKYHETMTHETQMMMGASRILILNSIVLGNKWNMKNEPEKKKDESIIEYST